jgi:hypothetical protein
MTPLWKVSAALNLIRENADSSSPEYKIHYELRQSSASRQPIAIVKGAPHVERACVCAGYQLWL